MKEETCPKLNIFLDEQVRIGDGMSVTHSASCGFVIAFDYRAREASDIIHGHYVAPPRLSKILAIAYPQLALWAIDMRVGPAN